MDQWGDASEVQYYKSNVILFSLLTTKRITNYFLF